jgi:hypothetical protein
MSIPEVKVSRRKFNDEHQDQKWFVLVGSIDGCPAVTKVDTISMAAIVSGAVSLDARIEKMKADVAEYYANFQAMQQLPDEIP